MSKTGLSSSVASIAASAVESAAAGSVLEVRKPVNVSAIFASICTVLLAIAFIEGTFDMRKKIKQDREFEIAQVQNAEWRARIERAIPMTSLRGRTRGGGRGPGASSSARDLLSDGFSEVSSDEDERDYAARSVEDC